MTRIVTALAILLATALPSAAHQRSASYSDWEIRGGEARVRLRVTALDASLLAGEAAPDEPPEAYFASRLGLSAAGDLCPLVRPPTPLAAAEGELAFEWRAHCGEAGPLAITSRILAVVAPGHLHFARVRVDGAPPRDRLLTRDAPTWALADHEAPDAAPAPVGLFGAVVLGVVHVTSGLDHVAFLAALLLGAAGALEVLAIVTAFTVAHSATLALATVGSVVPEAAVVESLIGLSIALVAAENLGDADARAASRVVGTALGFLALAAVAGIGRVPATTLAGLACFAPATMRLVALGRSRAALRSAIAFLFGLVHGFGFAGVLVDARLEGTELAVALFGFNVGVELGQIAIVAILASALALATRAGAAAGMRIAGSTALLAAGLAWFLVRAY